MQRTLNIPVDLILQVCKDKRKLELLAFRVYIMLVYKNATVFDLSVDKVKRLMRCTTTEATRLVEDAKDSDWFSYCKRRNSLRALSLKSTEIKVAKNKKQYRSDKCFKADLWYTTLSELVKRLRGIVILSDVAKVLREPSNCGANKETFPFVMIYQNTFAKKLGLSQGAVSKLVSYLCRIGWLNKTQQQFYRVKSLKYSSAEQRKKYSQEHHNCRLIRRVTSRIYQKCKVVDYNYYQCFGIGYNMTDDMQARFKHIIWDYDFRINKKA